MSKNVKREKRELLLQNFPPPPTNSNDFEKHPSAEKLKTLKEAIGDLPADFDASIANHDGTKHKVKINGYIGNRILEWDKPGPTIVGRGGGTGGPVIPVHPNKKRRFSGRIYSL